MKDAVGNELHIGDTVAFAQLGYRHIKLGKITRFTPKKAEVCGSLKESEFIILIKRAGDPCER